MLLLRRMVTLLLKEFCNMSFLGISLAELLKSHAKAEEVTEFYKGRIRSHNEKLNVFLDVAEENPEESGELHGLPLALKANISTQKLTTNASSKVLDTYIAPFNSTVAQKLSTAGGSLLGKTNMDAWAHGSSTETSDYGTTRNPYNIEYVPGGSSGGSAVAVAAGFAPAAIGTETAGSIRLPAAWSGVVGLKPTYGRVSRFGIVAMGSSWDCPGPMTQTVEDAALLLKYIACLLYTSRCV